MDLTFWVQGSEPEPYEVLVRGSGPALTIDCNCRAGSIGQLCRHRVGLIEGDTSMVVRTEHDVELLSGRLAGAPVLDEIRNLRALEKQADRLKGQISASKKKIARLMIG